nr:hypothetical protein [Tanacetum cinerariifolium]
MQLRSLRTLSCHSSSEIVLCYVLLAKEHSVHRVNSGDGGGFCGGGGGGEWRRDGGGFCGGGEWREVVVVVFSIMFNECVEMLSLYIRCLTDESRCYRQDLPPRTPAKFSLQKLFFTIKADQTLTITTTNRSNTLLPSQPPTDQTIIIVLMVPYEAFACLCGAGDVVLRESYKPKTRGKLYYACPRSKVNNHMFFCKEERVHLLVGSPGASTTLIYSSGSSSTPIYSSVSSTHPRYSPTASTPQSYSSGTSRNAECSNCKHLLRKIMVLEATVETYMHPEQHTVNSATLFHEVYNNMGKLGLE